MQPAADGLCVRHATGADLKAILRLLEAAGLPAAGVTEVIARQPADFVVAETAGERPDIVAAAGLEVLGDAAVLRSVAVAAEWRGRGLAAQLVRQLVDESQSRGIQSLFLLTTTAEDYFPRFGFTRVERSAVPRAIAATVEFTSACPATAVVMSRMVVAPPKRYE